MLVWNQVCAALAQYRNLSCSNEATNYFCNRNILVVSNCKRNILVVSNGGYDLRPQERPFVDKHLRVNHFQSFDCGIVHLVLICHGYPGTSLLALRFQLVGDVVFFVSRLLTVSVSVRSSFIYDVVGNGKEVHRVLDEFLIFLSSFTQESPYVQ